MELKDAYEELGVPQWASQDEVRERHKEIIKQWHPDLHHTTGFLDEANQKALFANVALDLIADAGFPHGQPEEPTAVPPPPPPPPPRTPETVWDSFGPRHEGLPAAPFDWSASDVPVPRLRNASGLLVLIGFSLIVVGIALATTSPRWISISLAGGTLLFRGFGVTGRL